MFKNIVLFSVVVLWSSPLASAEVPVEPHPNPAVLLESEDSQLRENKKMVYDFYRIVLRGWRVDRADEFLKENYIQHNPNVRTGRAGFKEFLSNISQGRTRPIPEHIDNIVSIQAEGDMVTLSFVWNRKDSSGAEYTTTWFDMFRVEAGAIAEHWDNAVKWE